MRDAFSVLSIVRKTGRRKRGAGVAFRDPGAFSVRRGGKGVRAGVAALRVSRSSVMKR